MILSLARILWMLLGWLELSAWTSVLYTAAFFPAKRTPLWYRHVFRLWCKVWTHALGVNLVLHQKHREPLPARYLLIANHHSAFEDIGIPALFDVDNLAKIEVRNWFLVGRISAAVGTLYVDRDAPESRNAAAKAIEQRLAEGRNVALYPEGGVKGIRLHERFNYGVFDISRRTGVPILPVFIHYEAQNDFFWSTQTLPQKLLQIMFAKSHRAHYYVFDAFRPEHYPDTQTYCDAVYRRYKGWQEKYLD